MCRTLPTRRIDLWCSVGLHWKDVGPDRFRSTEAYLQSALNNQLLCSLSSTSRDAILSACIPCDLPVGTSLYKPYTELRYAYFITSGIASVVVPMRDGESAEVAFIGKEGVTGTMQMMGPALIPTTCFIQLAATGLRIRATALERLFHTSEEIRHRLLEFIQQECFSLSQVSGCNRLHQASPRLARWLLMAQDRTNSPVLNFTQEFMAEMLGLRRTTVTSIACMLQDAGLIDYTRGKLEIVDRTGLEEHACECYAISRTLHDGLYRKQWRSWSAESPTF